MDFIEETVKKNFSRIWSKPSQIWSKFRFEATAIAISTGIIIISLLFFLKASRTRPKVVISQNSRNTKDQKNQEVKIVVDLAGAVEEPGVYEVTEGARLKDALVLGGGLSAEADRQYIARYFNLARVINDQEKIYIPSSDEVKEVPANFTPQVQGGSTTTVKGKININSATASELDSLPGVGKVTADKIISGRPYGSIDELQSKKTVSKSTFNKIKELITVN